MGQMGDFEWPIAICAVCACGAVGVLVVSGCGVGLGLVIGSLLLSILLVIVRRSENSMINISRACNNSN